MITLPFGLSVDLSSLLAGITLTIIAGWLTSLLALRKDERAVHLDQVTKERTKWRDNMRKVAKEVVQTYFDNKDQAVPCKVAGVCAKLGTSINPMDDKHDQQILSHFDELFLGTKSDLDVFTKQIALLFKHDWERIKWECTPIYVRVSTRFTTKQRKWRDSTYPEIDGQPFVPADCLRQAFNSNAS